MFGQYSNDYQGRLTLADMREAASKRHHLSVIDKGNSRKVANNTLEYTLPSSAGGIRYIQHFQTVILTFEPEGRRGNPARVTIDMGGWNSVTTRDRLNSYLPEGWGVHTDKGTPYLHNPAGTFPLDPYSPATFNLGTGEHCGGKLADLSQLATLKKLVADYIAKAKRGEWADPAGDPFLPIGAHLGRETMLEYLQSGYLPSWIAATGAYYRTRNESGAHRTRQAAISGKGLPSHELSQLRAYVKAELGI